jgi:hypothetical protein
MASDEKTGTVVAKRTEAFHTRMLQRAQMTTDRGAEVMASQGEKILSATTVDEIWDADTGGTIQGRDVPETMWRIHSFEPVTSNRTDLDNARGYYASMDATYLGGPRDVATANGLVIGQQYALQTGADLVLYKLAMFEAADAFPIDVMIHEIKTASGNTLLRLVRPPDMAVAGEAE